MGYSLEWKPFNRGPSYFLREFRPSMFLHPSLTCALPRYFAYPPTPFLLTLKIWRTKSSLYSPGGQFSSLNVENLPHGNFGRIFGFNINSLAVGPKPTGDDKNQDCSLLDCTHWHRKKEYPNNIQRHTYILLFHFPSKKKSMTMSPLTIALYWSKNALHVCLDHLHDERLMVIISFTKGLC